MAAISQRARILDGYKDRIQALFGPGTAANYFRSVTRRPWMPNAAVRDCATVVDNGQRRSESGSNDETGRFWILSWSIVIDLAANWEREKTAADWSDKVQAIALAVQNWLPTKGCMNSEYVSDEPIQVNLTSGEAVNVWVIEFETEYLADVGALVNA